jgi:hypothetical protein
MNHSYVSYESQIQLFFSQNTSHQAMSISLICSFFFSTASASFMTWLGS